MALESTGLSTLSLPTGTRLGPYEILVPLGSGGMGEVYRARDTRLHRDVAIKILPPQFAADAERVARFEREAHVVAALNHQNIAQIYGIEETAGVSGLVMELVEGPMLADLIASAGMPVDDALDVARQIAEGLEAAHDHGIIHRDLKPANVKVRPDGVVKVLDFGLARAMADAGEGAPVDNSPTMTSPVITRVGVILGTAAYMAPEQARGKNVDRRVDIWAFGCLLFEMLTGRRPFTGETVTDVLSAIVTREPDWHALPPQVPPAVARLVRRCLEKDPRRRLRDIGEARLTLEAPQTNLEDASRAAGVTAIPRSRGWAVRLLMAAVAILAAVAGLLGILAVRPRATPPPATITRFDVQPPDPGATLSLVFRPAVALSASGGTAAFVAASGGIDRVYLRTRSDSSARVIPGSEHGTGPVLSPDGKWVAFFADGVIRKAAIDGEASTLASARDVRGMAWSDDGTLFLTTDAGAPLVSMPATGGPMQPVTTLAAGERTHRWPDVLPGGRACSSQSAPRRVRTATTAATSMPSSSRLVSVAWSSRARRWRATAVREGCSIRRARGCTDRLRSREPDNRRRADRGEPRGGARREYRRGSFRLCQ